MTIYCMDTCAFLEGAETRSYPLAVFPTLWNNLDGLIEENRLISSEEVLIELKRKDDGIHEWAKARAGSFNPLTEAVQEKAMEILARFPRLVDTRKGRSGADPFVIAEAIVSGCTLVTQEDGGTANKPKMPFVARAFGLETIKLLDLVQEENWSF